MIHFKGDGAQPCAQADPDAWYPERALTPENRIAIHICKTRCHLTEECLQWALDNNETDGIWGGTTGAQRRRMKRHRAA